MTENYDNITYDFVVNDEDEVMLLLYAGESAPATETRIVLDAENHSAELFRNDDDSIVLEAIPDEIFDSLIDADKLLVCELSKTENEDDSRIVYAYEADIED